MHKHNLCEKLPLLTTIYQSLGWSCYWQLNLVEMQWVFAATTFRIPSLYPFRLPRNSHSHRRKSVDDTTMDAHKMTYLHGPARNAFIACWLWVLASMFIPYATGNVGSLLARGSLSKIGRPGASWSCPRECLTRPSTRTTASLRRRSETPPRPVGPVWAPSGIGMGSEATLKNPCSSYRSPFFERGDNKTSWFLRFIYGDTFG